MDVAFYAALDKWVNFLAEQQVKKEAGEPPLTDVELQARWNAIFTLPARLNTGFGSAAVWAWKCFRFKHPYLSFVAPVTAALGVLNGVFGYLSNG